MLQAVFGELGQTAREKLFAYRHLLAIPALGVAAPFLFLRFGHIPSGGALEARWNAAGLCALLLGQGLRVWGAGYIGRAGRSKRLKATTLTTAGPYAHVRNPLYLGNFFLCLGVMFLTESYLLLLLCVVIFWALYLPVIAVEEEFLQAQFGADYLAYRQRVPRLIPRLTAAWKGQGTFQWKNLRKEYLSLAGVASAVLFVKAIEQPTYPLSFLAASGLLLLVPSLLERALKKA